MSEYEPSCPRCGSSTYWQQCEQCDDGYVTDFHELMPLEYPPGYMTKCEWCHGDGGWWNCVSSRRYCDEEAARRALLAGGEGGQG